MKTILLLVFFGFVLSSCGGHKNKYTKCPAFGSIVKAKNNSSF